MGIKGFNVIKHIGKRKTNRIYVNYNDFHDAIFIVNGVLSIKHTYILDQTDEHGWFVIIVNATKREIDSLIKRFYHRDIDCTMWVNEYKR